MATTDINRTYLKDDNVVPPQNLCSILCSSSCRNMNDPATYTPFRLFSSNIRAPIEWPQKTDVCCWWCCHQFDTVPTCVPALYSLEKRLFEVFGIFCSWNCAKAYVQSGYSSDSSEQLMWMRILAQEVFHCNIDELNAAPPRIFLKMFGGHLSIDEFRQKSRVATSALLRPPLVSYPMVLQELQLQQQQEQEDGGRQTSPATATAAAAPSIVPPSMASLSGRIMGLQRPTPRKPPGSPRQEPPNPQNSMYVEFVRDKQEEVVTSCGVSPAARGGGGGKPQEGGAHKEEADQGGAGGGGAGGAGPG